MSKTYVQNIDNLWLLFVQLITVVAERCANNVKLDRTYTLLNMPTIFIESKIFMIIVLLNS